MDDLSPDTSREQDLFFAALERPVTERRTFLEGACHGEPELQKRIEALLVAADQPAAELKPADVSTLAEQATAESVEAEVGQMLGQYKILERVGEGGCGVVYVAEQTAPVRRRVALKVIRLGMDTKQVVARFEAERQALAMMDHPNIARALDAGTTDQGRPYFIMELVRGIRITDYCDQEKLGTKERLLLFAKVCHAIQHAHQKGIIHRDIKPSNILVTLHDGEAVPKVIDFGIAKATEGRLTDATVYTQLHQFIGTPAYMSPEQAEMSGLDVDTRSDIYSLGVLLYELLIGCTPFDGKELVSMGVDAMRQAIREKEPARPSTKLATLHGDELTTTAMRRSVESSKLVNLLRGDLDWIVLKCLEKDRNRRYETANGLAADLTRYLSDEPVVARPPSTLYRLQKAWRRNRAAYSTGIAIAVALVVGVVLMSWQMRVAREAQTAAELAQENEAAERKKADLKTEEAERERRRAMASEQQALANAKQARKNLYASDINLAQQSLKQNDLGRAVRLLNRHRPKDGEADLRGWEWRYLWQLTQGEPHTTLTNRLARGWDTSFSPDGSKLAVGWFDGRVELWDTAERRLLKTLTEKSDATRGRVAFAPRGNQLAASNKASQVILYDLDSDETTLLWQPASDEWDYVRIVRLAFSADSTRLAVLVEYWPNRERGIWVIDVEERRVVREFRSQKLIVGQHFGGLQLSADGQYLYTGFVENSDAFTIACIDIATLQERWRTDLIEGRRLSSLALSPDGRLLCSAAGFKDSVVRIWDAEAGRQVERLEEHNSWVCKLVFSPDGSELISASADQTIRGWDTSSWTESYVLRGHHDEVHAVAVSDDGRLIASASRDGDLILWKPSSRETDLAAKTKSVDWKNATIGVLDDSTVLMLPPNSVPYWLDPKTGEAPRSLPELGPSGALRFLDSNALCRWDGASNLNIYQWRENRFVERATVRLNGDKQPAGLAYNAARDVLAWSEESASHSLFLVNLSVVERRVEIRSDANDSKRIVGQQFGGLKFSLDGKYLLGGAQGYAGGDVWDVDSGTIVRTVREPLRTAVFAGDEPLLVTAFNDRGIHHEIAFYDLSQPEKAPHRIKGRHFCNFLGASPDGNLVVATTHGGEVKVFDARKQELIRSFRGHRGGVRWGIFTRDEKRLFTGGVDGLIKVWDGDDHQELLSLSGYQHAMLYLSPDEHVLFNRATDIWVAPSFAEIEAAEAGISR